MCSKLDQMLFVELSNLLLVARVTVILNEGTLEEGDIVVVSTVHRRTW